MESLTEQEVANALAELALSDAAEDADLATDCTRSFDEAGLLTTSAGFVLRLADGAEFQVTVVRSR